MCQATYHHDGGGQVVVSCCEYHAPHVCCQVEAIHGERAAELVTKAVHQNDQRHYTASARLYAQADGLPGFEWAELED